MHPNGNEWVKAPYEKYEQFFSHKTLKQSNKTLHKWMKENFSRQENELNKSLTNLVVKWGKLINNSRLNPMFQIIYKKHVVGKKNFQIFNFFIETEEVEINGKTNRYYDSFESCNIVRNCE